MVLRLPVCTIYMSLSLILGERSNSSYRQQTTKLTTTLVSSHMYFPSSIFVQCNLPYQFNCTSTFNFTSPSAHTNYMYHSIVPSVILSWNNLPDSVKLFSSISCFKWSLLYHFEEHVSH